MESKSKALLAIGLSVAVALLVTIMVMFFNAKPEEKELNTLQSVETSTTTMATIETTTVETSLLKDEEKYFEETNESHQNIYGESRQKFIQVLNKNLEGAKEGITGDRYTDPPFKYTTEEMVVFIGEAMRLGYQVNNDKLVFQSTKYEKIFRFIFYLEKGDSVVPFAGTYSTNDDSISVLVMDGDLEYH